MERVVITEFMDEDGVAFLRPDFDVHYDPQLVDKPDELKERLKDCRGLIVRNKTQVNAALLAGAPKLAVVGRLGVGLDNIELKACAARKIPVLPATNTNDETVAEFVMGAIAVLLRGGAYGATPAVLAGKWPRTEIKGRDIKGLRLGLVGFGAIARQVAIRGRAFGMSVSAYDPFVARDHRSWADLGVRPGDMDRLAKESDIVSVHVPLTSETRDILDARRLALMPRGGYVINTGRGGIINEKALADALRSGHLAGAHLDVMEAEPLPANSLFVGVPNLFLTPHIAGITREAVLRASLLTAENVALVLKGKPPKVADAAAGA